jgi:hypothetical protein
VPEDDRALAFALDDDRGGDDHVTLALALLPLLDDDRDGVRDLLPQGEKELLRGSARRPGIFRCDR